ncbi:MAG TPA: sugar ABC transporter substrate-binding protein [Burkholderiales bacterium]|nr:sugar ABC transporter substrate-binding protein [Burkholderiales bacterium]
MNSAGQPTLAVFTKNRLNPAYHAARLGAERTAARMGGRTVNYVPEKPDDVEQQIALIEQALAARPDAFVFVPVHGTAIDASVRKIAGAGVPLVNFINRLRHAEDYVSFVGSDDYSLATQVAARLFRELRGAGDVIVLEGTPASVTSQDRVRGFRDAARAHPGIRLVASRPGNFLQEEAKRAMRALLAGTPKLDGVLAANDSMALGALDALAETRRTARVVGVNAIPDAIAALKDGRLLATADFDALKLACIATEAAIRHLRGEAVPKEILLPVQIVDASNCAAWDRPIEQRAAPRWEEVVR